LEDVISMSNDQRDQVNLLLVEAAVFTNWKDKEVIWSLT
jgi:hypothetical protein